MTIKILTIDDSKAVRMIVQKAFKSYECTICEASNGDEGLVVAAAEKPDLILLDITMPGMDGISMLTHLRANPELKSIPVIMLSAENSRENVALIAGLGIQGYVVTPFKDEQIVANVRAVVPLEAKPSEVVG
jgi:CheY-like chemotaxis protein